MKVVSFNANGIRSAERRGFFEWLSQEAPDIVCIQETKAQVSSLVPQERYFPHGYHCTYVDAKKRGYSGVAIFAKQAPQRVICTSDFPLWDDEGRFVEYEYPDFSVVSIYLPSGTSGEARQEVKFQFLEELAAKLENYAKRDKPVILCGDFNIAHKEIDLKNWRANQKNSGFLPEERAFLDRVFGDMGFTDAFRHINPEPEQYTWWSMRAPQARAKNVGWRIDYHIVSNAVAPHVHAARIETEAHFSDHAPLIIEYKGIGSCFK